MTKKQTSNLEPMVDPVDSLRKTSSDKPKAGRYGIAEWYGKDIITMTSEERKHAADVATGRKNGNPICPFLATLSPGANCNKKGGVCTIRRYETSATGCVTPAKNASVATTCPARFLGPDASGRSILEWVSEKMLDCKPAILVKETPFLRTLLSRAATTRLAGSSDELEPQMFDDGILAQAKGARSDETETKKAGRIDWLLMDPQTEKDKDPSWCALETQAVYFSGDKMGPEFEAYALNPEQVLFPIGFRRPDYRSSGPKRLAPQLSVKVPVLRGWGKKVAVLVDKYFFDCMYDLPEAYAEGRTDQEKRDNCEVAWFVVDYDAKMCLTLEPHRFSTLSGSVVALNATAPMSKEAFNISLRALVANKRKLGKKVFKP
jgi:hypothetical protein